MKKILPCMLFACMFSSCLNIVELHAEGEEETAESTYTLEDFTSGTVLPDTYYDYDSVYYAYQNNVGNYGNLGILKDDKIIAASHAIASIHSSDACDVNVNTVDYYSEEDSYVNGCYGKDAAYLLTDETGSEALIEISGAKMYVSLDDIDLIPTENIMIRTTMYLVQNGKLYHEIKGELEDDYYASIIDQGPSPSYLSEGESYYSYDGHYFYNASQLNDMLDDLKNNSHDHSVNPSDPWYDYYQFVSHRTLTSASADDVENYFNENFGITRQMTQYADNDKNSINDSLTRSQYVENFGAFWQYQYEYGANALMMLALSENESAFGRSSLCYTRNNLFGHAAYDSDVEANASRYLDVANSIYSHAKYYISGSYCSPLKTQFHGGFFGNKENGMNVSYASDPYWGEKAASNYREMDDMLGGGDNNLYTLGIRTQEGETPVYDAPDGNVIYQTGTAPDMAFVILWQEGDWYAVQSEATLDESRIADLSYAYDYQSDYGYIKASDIQLILPGTKQNVDTYVHVTFNGAGGAFPGMEDSVSYTLPSGNTAYASVPDKESALFTGWDQDTANVTQDTVFTAQYKDVDNIVLSSVPQSEYEVNDRINIANGMVQINFSDGSSQEVPMRTSMISGFDLTQKGQQTVTVYYAGCSTSYDIVVNEEMDETRARIKDEITNIIQQYQGQDTITGEDAEKVIALKKKIDSSVLPYLTQQQLREFDRILRKAYQNRIRYIVDENDYDLGVSGLCVITPLEDSQLHKNKILEDTYRVRITRGISTEAEDAMKKSASFLENDEKDSFTISGLKNQGENYMIAPIVFSIDKPADAQKGEVYTVLHYSEDGDVDQCYTRQTDGKITFMSNTTGEFMLVSRMTSNDYVGEDPVEVVTRQSSSFDMERALMYVGVGLIILALIVTLILLLVRKAKKKKLARNQSTKQERVKKEVDNLEVTQALEILNTKVLNIDEIQKAAEKEEQKENDQHDRTPGQN